MRIDDGDVLAQLDFDHLWGEPTYVVRNMLVKAGYPRTLQTRHVLSKLKELESDGIVIRTFHSQPNSLCWAKA